MRRSWSKVCRVTELCAVASSCVQQSWVWFLVIGWKRAATFRKDCTTSSDYEREISKAHGRKIQTNADTMGSIQNISIPDLNDVYHRVKSQCIVFAIDCTTASYSFFKWSTKLCLEVPNSRPGPQKANNARMMVQGVPKYTWYTWHWWRKHSWYRSQN